MLSFRRSSIKIIKIVFIISSTFFLMLQIHMRRKKAEWSSLEDIPQFEMEIEDRKIGAKDFEPSLFEFNRSMTNGKDFTWSSHTARDTLKSAVTGLVLMSPEDLRKSVEDNNAHAEIHNEKEFSHEPIAHVVIVQVHNRPKYLDKLIQSISHASLLNRTLLIFSHDYYSDEIYDLVKSVQFCRVMQLFFPHSLQLYSNVFPAEEPGDCKPGTKKSEAEKQKCNNWKSPDKYGNYRIATYSQVKHHWWWKINYVFGGIPKLDNYTGYVLLLEEDHYVSPDFLYVFDQIINRKSELCDECNIISLGFYLKRYDSYSITTGKLSVYPWFSSHHNMGMAFNRSTWNRIRQCAAKFCDYDDYNWDWSLLHVSLKCMSPPPFKVIFAKAPRVFHIGDCGIHHTGKQCTADSSATRVAEILNGAKTELFPKKLEVVERSVRTLKAPKENGGWGDSRDRQLCFNNTLFKQDHVQR